MTRRTASLSLCVAFVLSVAACSGSSTEVSSTARDALAPVTTSTTTTAPPTSTTGPTDCNDGNVLDSLPAAEPFPEPGAFAEGGTLREIYDRDYLIAGIDENTPHLGVRDPRNAAFDGLEVELVHQIAQAMFGDREKVKFKTVVTKEKNQVVEDGIVDLTASADSITCERKQDVAFSDEYLRTGHVLLVRSNDDIANIDDLAGRPVCVTAGSSSVKLLAQYLPKARPVEVDARNDCLVALQQGEADAYLGHTTFVRGMQEQDSNNLAILPGSLNTQHYGIAIGKEHPELVMFVNGVLAQMRADGRLADLFRRYGLPESEIPPEEGAR